MVSAFLTRPNLVSKNEIHLSNSSPVVKMLQAILMFNWWAIYEGLRPLLVLRLTRRQV